MNRFVRSSSRSIGSGKPSNNSSMSVRFAGVSPFGMSIFVRKMRFLPPINLSAIWINGDSNAPFCLIGARPRVALAGVDQGFDVRTIHVRAHHAHSFAVAPIKFAALLLEMELLWRECLAFANNGYAILAIEIDALDRTIVLARNAHVRPVNVSGFNIDDDAIRDPSSADDDFSVRPIGVSGVNLAAACFEIKQSASRCFAAGC